MYIDNDRYADARTQLELVGSLPVSDNADPHYKTDAVRLLAEIRDKH